MTVLNLFEIWHNEFLVGSVNRKISAIFESSIAFLKPVKALFIDKNKNIINRYSQLESIELDDEEQLIVENQLINLKNNSKFYDSKQVLIIGIYYDNHHQIIYLKAKKCKFSVLNALATGNLTLNNRLFNLNLSRAGVIAPFITNDNCTFLIERRKNKLYSAASGLLEAKNDIIGMMDQ